MYLELEIFLTQIVVSQSMNLFGAGVIKKDLGEIKSIWSHINWTLIPPAALHRIGAAESMVKATRRSLCYLPTSSPSILEFDVVFKNIASAINNRTVHYTSR